MSGPARREARPVEVFRTDAYQAGWQAFEAGASRADTPYPDARPFAAWYDWRAGFDDRARLEVTS